MILVRTDLEGARRVAEVVRASVEALGRTMGYDAGVVTASVGVAAYDPGFGDGTDVLDVADEGLYRAKAVGGNRVATAEEAESSD